MIEVTKTLEKQIKSLSLNNNKSVNDFLQSIIDEYIENLVITDLLLEQEKKIANGTARYLTPDEFEKSTGIDLSQETLANLPDEDDEFY